MATLLIVEDDKQTNDAICEYMKSAGHKIISAYDGAEALQLFIQNCVDLVVLDIMLPSITGLAVLHKIRQKNPVPIFKGFMGVCALWVCYCTLLIATNCHHDKIYTTNSSSYAKLFSYIYSGAQSISPFIHDTTP